MNSFSMNASIRAKFPTPQNDRERLLQVDTINALSNLLVEVAARLESTNQIVTPADLRREAQALRDYTETLAPDTEVITR
jgi:hypothetical protein